MIFANVFFYNCLILGIHQLLIYSVEIYSAVRQAKETDVVYTDLEKAFDRVDHGILLQKLSDFGARGKLLILLSSYVSGRKQSVKVGNNL